MPRGDPRGVEGGRKRGNGGVGGGERERSYMEGGSGGEARLPLDHGAGE